jgi:hypothetical protein
MFVQVMSGYNLLGEARSDYAWSGQVISGYIVLGRVM